jgi:hypothetical protein
VRKDELIAAKEPIEADAEEIGVGADVEQGEDVLPAGLDVASSHRSS